MSTNLQRVISAAAQGSPPSTWTATTKSIVALGVAAGMAYLHSKRILHRDLKPANVLLDANSEPRIGGFGWSRFVSPGDELTMKIGSPLFTAPEISMGDDYSFPIDVFSYGIFLYAIVTDSLPFQDKSPFVVVNSIVRGERPAIPAFVSTSVGDVITDCWARNPADRPTFEEILQAPDRLLLEGCDRDAFENYRGRVLNGV
jgi:serine/threonine protein kinase